VTAAALRARVFSYGPGPHSIRDHVQLAIQAHDLTRAECRLLKAIVTNNRMDTKSYQLGQKCGRFLQGYEEPWPSDPRSGWVLVEFWCNPVEQEDAVRVYVDHVNEEFARMKNALLADSEET
jgi:hypothetical protein